MGQEIGSVAVIGLGRIGLALAAAFAGAGLRMVGVDRDPAPVAALNAGEILSSEPGLRESLASAAHGLEASSDPAALMPGLEAEAPLPNAPIRTSRPATRSA